MRISVNNKYNLYYLEVDNVIHKFWFNGVNFKDKLNKKHKRFLKAGVISWTGKHNWRTRWESCRGSCDNCKSVVRLVCHKSANK